MNICSKNVVVDYRTDSQSIKTLKSYGFNLIKTKKINNLYEAVNGHTDLQIVKVNDDLIVCPECFQYYKAFGIKNIIKGSSSLQYKYPEDIFYNAAIFGKYAVHNFRFTDSVLKDTIKKNFLFEINVNQGYSKCSICIISDNAIITEDEGIAKTLSCENVDVLKIEKGSVKLKGLNYGFFGGATGLWNNTLFINGELKYHTDNERIRKFCKNHNVTIKELKLGEIYDIGSILFEI